MSSPRSMWSGQINLGLVNIPVSIAKAWSEDRESGLRDLCATHNLPVERFERCHEDNAVPENVLKVLHSEQDYRQQLAHIESFASNLCGLAGGKAKGVEVEEGVWQAMSENDMAKIEQASASDVLTIEDYRPAHELPMEFGIGTYFVRYNPPKKGSTVGLDTFATFAKVLGANGYVAVVMWKLAGTHRLCALQTATTGELLLTVLPTAEELRQAAEKERRHIEVETAPEAEALFHQLLTATARPEWKHSAFRNEAKELRTAAVDKILAEHNKGDGEQKQDEKKEQKKGDDLVPDLMRQLQESMKNLEQTESEKV